MVGRGLARRSHRPTGAAPCRHPLWQHANGRHEVIPLFVLDDFNQQEHGDNWRALFFFALRSPFTTFTPFYKRDLLPRLPQWLPTFLLPTRFNTPPLAVPEVPLPE
jgi:hypothetical protein